MKHIAVSRVRWETSRRTGIKTLKLSYIDALGRRVFMPKPTLRTGPDPTKKMMRYWNNEAAIIRHQWQAMLNSRGEDALIRVPVVTAAAHFILYAEENGYAASTIARFDHELRRFGAWITARFGTKHTMGTLGTGDYAKYRNYLSELGLSAATVNTSLADLSSWNRWALGENYVTQNFVRLVNKCSVSSVGSPLAITGADEYWRVIQSEKLNDFQVAVIGLLACTGMRIGELRCLRWDSAWDVHAGVLHIGASQRDTKTKRHGRFQPVCVLTRRYLQMLRLMQDGPWVCGQDRGRQPLTSQVATWLKPFGLCPKHFRSWFRTALVTVSRQSQLRYSDNLINDMMGHMMTKTRKAYERLDNWESMVPLKTEFCKWLMAAKPSEIRILPPPTNDEDLGSGNQAIARIYPDIPSEMF
jgi:integrase